MKIKTTTGTGTNDVSEERSVHDDMMQEYYTNRLRGPALPHVLSSIALQRLASAAERIANALERMTNTKVDQ